MNQETKTDKTGAAGDVAIAGLFGEAATLVPTSWLDPLLTGPDKVIGKPPYDCKDIERLLRSVKARIADHSPNDKVRDAG